MRIIAHRALAPLLLAIPLPANAHAVILAAEPAPGASLQGPRVEVDLRFSSRIDAERSRLTLTLPDGDPRVLPLAHSDRPDTLAATIDGLAPGRYRLRWQVLAVDGHITRGDIPFAVSP